MFSNTRAGTHNLTGAFEHLALDIYIIDSYQYFMNWILQARYIPDLCDLLLQLMFARGRKPNSLYDQAHVFCGLDIIQILHGMSYRQVR